MDESIRPRRPDDPPPEPCPWCHLQPGEVTGQCSACGRTQTDTVSERVPA